VREGKVFPLVSFIAGIQLIVSNSHQRKAPFVSGNFQILIMKTLTLLFLLLSNAVFGQGFQLSDTTLKIGDSLVIRTLYDGDCSIYRNTSFVDSLANFLVSHPNVSIEIEFHESINGNSTFLQKRTEICGKSRVEDFFKNYYPNIMPESIVFKCLGGSKPIYSKQAINALLSEDEKQKAHVANRRTVIRILSL